MCFSFKPFSAIDVMTQFVDRAGGEVLAGKLVKLAYLLDRSSMKTIMVPIVGGTYHSASSGPVIVELNQLIYSGMCPPRSSSGDRWRSIVTYDQGSVRIDLDGRNIYFQGEPHDRHLSRYDLKKIQEVHDEFGHMSEDEIGAWTREHCGEWSYNPDGDNIIDVEDLGIALDMSGLKLEEFRVCARENALLEELL